MGSAVVVRCDASSCRVSFSESPNRFLSIVWRRLCELLVVKCQRLKKIRLKSGRSDSCQERQQQDQKLKEIGQSLVESAGRVELVVEYDDVIHDREIRFDNGWIVKIGRGLDIFKGDENDRKFLFAAPSRVNAKPYLNFPID